MKRISVMGIVAGALVVVVAEVLGSVVLSAMFADGALDPESAMAALEKNRSYRIGSLMLGTLATALGGYVAARIARSRHFVHAAGVGAIHIALGLFLSSEYPLLLIVPVALLGGYVARLRDSAREQAIGNVASA